MSIAAKDSTGYSPAVEIVSIEISTNAVTCPPVPAFPRAAAENAGALTQKKIPLVCSGYGSSQRDCFLLMNNTWVQTGSLNQGRYHAQMLPNSPFQNSAHQAIIIGGFYTNTMEVFDGSSWTFIGPFLPISFIAATCSVYINPTTVFMVSGYQGPVPYSPDTYFLNGLEKKWISGPKVIMGRYDHACGRIPSGPNTIKMSTIMAGGSNNGVYLNSVEILDDDTGFWRSGPNLPGPGVAGGRLFPDPRGGIIFIGGSSASGVVGTLYRLRHAGINENWETLVVQTKLKRTSPVIIPIPDEIAVC